jgi:HAD superfamily hydrolase (TIGR01509 family)
MSPDLVIFDCDGVLVDSETITDAMLVADFAAHGLHLTAPEVSALFVGGTMRAVGEKARELGANLPPDWVEGFYTRMYARLAEGTPLIDGILEVFEKLDAVGIPYRVCSNGSDEKMAITLGQHPQLWRRLEGKLFSAHAHGTAKPDPGLLLLAAKDAGAAPERAVMVDDSPVGCIAAGRAGMRALGFAGHTDGARLRAVGAEVFHHMAELPGLLGV